MLQTQTIEPRTLSVLNNLMKMPQLNQFNLVGGTALSLKYGHRTSIDLDLFSTEDFEHEPLIESLQKTFGKAFNYRGNYTKWEYFVR